MTKLQQVIFAIVMTQLFSILILLHLLVDNYTALGVAKYAVISSIFISSLFFRKPTKEHKFIAIAILFLFIGDFFLILIGTFPGISPNDFFVKIGGMVGFLIAYLSLIYVYQKNLSFGKQDIIAMLPVLAVVIPAMIILIPYVKGLLLLWALVFTTSLGFMAWSAICTVHRGYYNRKTALRFAIAGYLMFLSDMGVGFSFFYPGLHRNMPWLGNEIWLTYIPAWTLILINLTEEKLAR